MMTKFVMLDSFGDGSGAFSSNYGTSGDRPTYSDLICYTSGFLWIARLNSSECDGRSPGLY